MPGVAYLNKMELHRHMLALFIFKISFSNKNSLRNIPLKRDLGNVNRSAAVISMYPKATKPLVFVVCNTGGIAKLWDEYGLISPLSFK